MSVLFEPMTLRSLTIANRIFLAPMCQYSAECEGPNTGAPTDWHLAHLGARAIGGAGLLLTEATAVAPEGRISSWDLGLWNDRQQEAFARLTRFVRDQGARIGVQLAHAGRKAATGRPWRNHTPSGGAAPGWQPVGPSSVPFDEGAAVPEELTADGIARVVRQFADAARRAHRAGFEVVELHGAHGYLIHEFLSPRSNRRTDAYGGSFGNRIRLALQVAEAVREVWPDELPVFFRVSATDWLAESDAAGEDDSWTVDQTVRLAKELLVRGVDLLDVSSGGNVPGVAIPATPGYQVPFAARVRAEADVPVGAVGLITDPHQAEAIVAKGEADAVLLGRELLRDPQWPLRAARALGTESRVPHPYLRAF
ncbi:NADH:flavin oxidoreductase/NADH oxidase [Streptomyces sp.]|uniref:NADH:flavin oxidoreductase/NADH oxidase n=1 Tax=Streptomyces sp. TaxID=1931 RepID=UPI002F405CFF